MFFSGLGMPTDPNRGFSLWKRLADAGNAEAQDWVGYYYAMGTGTKRDPLKAEQYLLRSAQQGYVEAMKDLSLFYWTGEIGCCVDPQKSVHWSTIAAERGDIASMDDLVRAYSTGDGVPRNDEEAFKWALRAAQHDRVRSYLFLGYAALHGTGTDKDLVEAYKRFNLAAAHTETVFVHEAVRERDAVAEQLSQDEFRKAQCLSLDWQSKITVK
jgi:TPR repeat protein